MAKSADRGHTFAAETQIFGEGTGICGCCGSRALADPGGSVYVTARSATKIVHRDIWLLVSSDRGACKGPTNFDCEHGDLLYVYPDLSGSALKAIYFAFKLNYD
jgi:hypothetical protein